MSDDLHWYQDAVIYQLRIGSFFDSNGDGVGDLRGVTAKLDYLQDLGVTAIWMLPFYPSPLRDDGYDIADYTSVKPDIGTIADFRRLLREAHARGLKVITELVLNHTSDQHPWFQRARRAQAGSRWRDFYVWTDDPRRYREARIIFKDFEPSNWSWDPVAKAYYWHRFFHHQPDLNFENPEVRRAMFRILDFWLGMGVDGLRLDAVPYLFEREGTSCENLPETHEFLKQLRAHVDERYPGRMLLAEANQWPEDVVHYFGDGDECHMAYHFPIMPRLFMAVQMEDRYPVLDIMEQTPPIPPGCQWAMFLRNHDELTLEMVTDEERDYMWRVYARDTRARINLGIRRRLAPLMENDRRRIELLKGLLFSLPGTPILYYGDEIGMGDNVYLGDRNGVRTPMQWSPDRNAGFSRANPQKLFLPVVADPEYHFEAVNVEVQQANPTSLLWFTKRLLALRREFRAFGRGTLEFLTPANRRVLAMLRRHEDERLLLVYNLSRLPQFVELDLSEFRGGSPTELFGRVEFPRIGDLPYLLTLGPYEFRWFAIGLGAEVGAAAAPPAITVSGAWTAVLGGRARDALEKAIAGYLPAQRWFRGKARAISQVHILDHIPVPSGDAGEVRITLLRTEYDEGDPEIYVLPLAFDPACEVGDPDRIVALRIPQAAGEVEGALVDATARAGFADALLSVVARRRRLRGRHHEIQGTPARGFRRLAGAVGELHGGRLGREQTNTSFQYGERLVGKLLRKVDEGINPDLEMLERLTNQGFPHVPELAGHLNLHADGRELATVAVFQSFVANEGDAWRYTLDQVALAFERTLSDSAAGGAVTEHAEGPETAYLWVASLLGRRVGELHAALAADLDDPTFAPEPITPFARRAVYQSLRNLVVRVRDLARASLGSVPEPAAAELERLIAAHDRLLERMRTCTERGLRGAVMRVHGDLHLGQVLFTGRDFVIIDFEGEPARSLGERRRKRSPMVDVAGMLRSYHYVVETVTSGHMEGTRLRPEDRPTLQPHAERWLERVGDAFVTAYLEQAQPIGVLPEDPDALHALLELHLLEKALYEVGYELNNRPAWVGIPLHGLVDRIEADRDG